MSCRGLSWRSELQGKKEDISSGTGTEVDNVMHARRLLELDFERGIGCRFSTIVVLPEKLSGSLKYHRGREGFVVWSFLFGERSSLGDVQ